MAQVTRRNFLEVAGAAGAAAALAACDTTTPETPADDEGSKPADKPADEPQDEPQDEPEEPEGSGHDLSEYPLDPDGDDVDPLYEIQAFKGWFCGINQDGPKVGAAVEERIDSLPVIYQPLAHGLPFYPLPHQPTSAVIRKRSEL